jgi:flavin-dependent dehydrogenase
MVGFYLKNTLSDHGSVSRGVCTRDANGMLTTVLEMTKIFKHGNAAENREVEGAYVPLTGDEVVSMNFFGFTPDIFPHLRKAFVSFLERRGAELKSECYVPAEVDALINVDKAEVRVLETTGKWIGVTYPEDKAVVVASIRKLIDAGEYPQSLWG